MYTSVVLIRFLNLIVGVGAIGSLDYGAGRVLHWGCWKFDNATFVVVGGMTL